MAQNQNINPFEQTSAALIKKKNPQGQVFLGDSPLKPREWVQTDEGRIRFLGPDGIWSKWIEIPRSKGGGGQRIIAQAANATDVTVSPISCAMSATNVQQALEALCVLIDALGDGSLEDVPDFMSWFIEIVDDKDYLVVVNSPIGYTVESITTKCESGTCTLTGKINGVALGGSANAVSASEVTQVHASNNVSAAGDDLTLTVSANADCQGVTVTMKIIRDIP